MAIHVINKINSRLRFLYRQNRYLSFPLRRLLCNAMIQPFIDYACNACYPNINKKLKKCLQAAQNKCIRFCLKLDDRFRLKSKEFERINWLLSNRESHSVLYVTYTNSFQSTLGSILKNYFFQQKKLLFEHVPLFKN